MAFLCESDLVEFSIESPFLKGLVKSAYFPTIYMQELKGYFGIPDLVVLNYCPNQFGKKIYRSIAFEMKLTNWKRALMQAYRYRSFIEYSYVIIDDAHLGPPLKSLNEFRKFNIGLISVSTTGSFFLHYAPAYTLPYCDQLRCKFEGAFTRDKNLILNNNPMVNVRQFA